MRSVFRYLGVTDTCGAAIEYDEFGGERLALSIADAESATVLLAETIAATRAAAARRAA